MAALDDSQVTPTTARPVWSRSSTSPGWGRVLGLATLAGAALGSGDLLLQLQLPYPWADLANSSSVWAVAAFMLAFAVTRRPVLGVLAGVVVLVVAVEAYYAAAVLTDHSSVATMWAPSTMMWIEFGLLAGIVFGWAGARSRSGRRRPVTIGAALVLGVMLAQAAVWFDHPVFGRTPAVATAALGLLAVATLGATTRRPGAALIGCVAAVPVAVLSAAALAWGFGT